MCFGDKLFSPAIIKL